MPLVQLPLVYLDWNIFDGFSKDQFTDLGERLLTARDNEVIHVPYSEWHLYEAVNVSSEVKNHQELVTRNLETIRKYSNQVCIWEDDNPVGWIIMRSAYDSEFNVSTAQKLVLISELFKPILATLMTVKEQLIPFGLQPGILNKYSTEEAASEINRLLLKPENLEKYKQYAPSGITFDDLLRLSLDFLPDKNNTIQAASSIYFMVDMLGYYSDKSVQKNIMSLWRDSMHVAWGSRCQLVISNDKRFRMKAELTYRALGIQTSVLDPDLGKEVISAMIANGDHIKKEMSKFRAKSK